MKFGAACERAARCLSGAALALVMTACVTAPSALPPDGAPVTSWSGRLALRVDSQPPQSMSASFELAGAPQKGVLTLLTPIGTAAAVLTWAPGSATLQQGADFRSFGSLADMITEVTGTPVPVPALFDWLDGRATAAPGWEPDLSHIGQGRLVARRTQPEPRAELRVILTP
jgi:outer membrane lipoprotein LolB